MKNESKSLTLLEKLQDNNYALYFAIFTCIALAPNSYFMFHKFSIIPTELFARELQAGAVAILIAGSILYYTAKKNLKYASIFANFEFFISCCYYFQSLIMKDNPVPVWNWHIIPAIAFAYILPWSVKGYAESIDYDQISKRMTIITPPIILPDKQIISTPLNQRPTEELLNIIERDEIEDAFGKGSISAIK